MNLEKLGQRIIAFFKDDVDCVIDTNKMIPTLRTLLPYKAYDEQHDLYINKDSVGFVLQFDPIVGLNETLTQELTSLFQEVMQEESSFQFLLYADPRIDHELFTYAQIRNKKSEILSELM